MDLKNTKISKNTWVVIILLFLLTVISNADKAIIGFASVPIMDELGLTPEQWGIVGSVFFLLYSLCAILGGTLADRFGTKMVIIGMVIVWSLVQFSTIFVSGFAYLLITRIILGAGEGPSYSLAMTAATKWLPKEKLGIGISFISIGGPLGVAVSAPILMNMVMNYGWRSAFIATGVIGVVWIVAWMLSVKNDKATIDNNSIVKESSDVIENQSQVKFKSVVLSKNFIFIALSGFATYWAFTVGLNWLPNYLEKVRQLNPETLQLVVSLPWILITISQITFSSISDRLFLKTNNIVKSRVSVLGLVMISGAACYLLGTLIGLEALAITLLFLGLTFGCITLVLGPTILSQLVSREHQGKVQGWFMAITSLGGIAGPYVTGILVQNGATQLAGFHSAFQVCALVMFVCGGLVLAGVRPKKTRRLDMVGTGTVQNV